ncbi:MAG TPA: 2'-5' RNA ligase family protein [Gaiellaceae bacterium]|nr:2'-5' RNA ligase family protein [Gaiellaceae bacterium]
MAELALAVPFEGVVQPVGVPQDLPAHVTVLYPAPDEVQEIAKVLAPFEPFDVGFSRLDRFPGVLWLAPEPAEPFVAMTEAMVERFPDFLPYGGVFASIVPHLTVAQAQLDETAALIEPLLPIASRVDSVVLYASVDGAHWHEHATFDLAG